MTRQLQARHLWKRGLIPSNGKGLTPRQSIHIYSGAQQTVFLMDIGVPFSEIKRTEREADNTSYIEFSER